MFFRSFGNGTSVPVYNRSEDSIVLQIKSLLYVFKRLRINKLGSFCYDSKAGSLRYTDSLHYDEDEQLKAYYEKLDKTYNIEGFKKKLTEDEYRVLIDYGKNKFRSLCIVFETPNVNVSRPGSPVKGETAPSTEASGPFPVIVDYKERPIKAFEFLLISPNMPIDTLVHTLAYSQLYIEHIRQVPYSTRHQYAKECIDEEIALGNTSDINEVKLASIIERFLKKLAFNIQLNRIYEEYIRQMLPVKQSPSSSSLRSVPSVSNVNIAGASAGVSASLSKSPTRSLKSKPSISKLRLGDLYSLNSPPSLSLSGTNWNISTSLSTSTSLGTSTSTNNSNSSTPIARDAEPGKALGVEVRFDVWEKCKTAVHEKLSKERKIIDLNTR